MSNKFQKNTLLITAIAIVLIAIYGLKMSITQDVGWGGYAILDQIVSIILIGIAYKFRRRLGLKNYTTVLGSIFLLIHNIGSLGPYGWRIGILGYDKGVHFFAGLTLFFLFYEYFMHSFERGKHVHKLRTLVLAMLSTLGVGAITEIIEFIVGYMYNGPGVGFFFYGVGDFGEWNDSIFDMSANFVGTLLGIIIMYIKGHGRKKRRHNKRVRR